MRNIIVGFVALAIAGGAVALTGMALTGALRGDTVTATAEFDSCGQVLSEDGDVKLRGVLVGRIGALEKTRAGTCRLKINLFPQGVDQIPANVRAQIQAKTFFGEKFVALLYPQDPAEARISDGDVIPRDRTIEPIEVETILNVALPLLEAIDPENLAGALEALTTGFVGQEQAAIRGIEAGIDALEPLNRNEALLREGLDQLAGSSDVLADVDDDLLQAFENLDAVNRFTVEQEALIEENFAKAPALLREVSSLFETRFGDFTEIVDRGATVIGVLAARSDDLDRLIDTLPVFNSNWIRNLNHVCRVRQASTEEGRSRGDRIPGRCWRVHNITSESRSEGRERSEPPSDEDFQRAGLEKPSDVGRVLYSPALKAERS